MPAEDIAEQHYQDQGALGLAAVTAILRLWALVDPLSVIASWVAQRLAEQIFVFLSMAQTTAATNGARMVAAVAEDYGIDPPDPIDPMAFAGIASDGRDLETLLISPIVAALQAQKQGMEPVESMTAGANTLQTIVETQVADAGRVASHVAVVSTPGLTRWVRMLELPSCARCAILAGRIYRWSDGFERHPRCLPAGSVVSGPATAAATRRWYEGELTVIRTARGKELAVTGNHPVLTGRGWVPARLIVEGDDVISRAAGDRAVGLLVPDKDQMPALIEDVWRSGRVDSLRRVPVAAEDFHGDGSGGYVDVVAADGFLGDRVTAQVPQKLRQALLALRAVAAVAFADARAGAQLGFGGPLPAAGLVGGGHLLLPGIGRHAARADHAGLAGVPDRLARVAQALPDYVAADLQAFRDGQFAFAGSIGGDDRRHVKDAVSARWDAPAVPFSVQSARAYADVGQDLRLRLTGQVEADRVVEAVHKAWSGHVYNLSSSEGWYDANGIIVSNCDCTHIPLVEDDGDDLRTDPMAYFNSLSKADQDKYFTAAGAEAIRLGADIGQVVNARRTAAGLSQAGRLTAEERKLLRGGRNRGALERVDVFGQQVFVTGEGTTRRGLAGARLGAGRSDAVKKGSRYRRARTPRLMPESIIELANGDRGEAVRLLTRFGYIL